MMSRRKKNKSNIEYNKDLWNNYAKKWDKKTIHIENKNIDNNERGHYLKYLGDEWGNSSDVNNIIEEFIYPYITKESIVGEIGVGGGRIASKVYRNVKEFHCFDISSGMLKTTKNNLDNAYNVRYFLIEKPEQLNIFADKFDFIYSFDSFVHMDLHTIWKYFKEIRIMLKKGGKSFIHTTNLNAPGGWNRFNEQDSYSVEGHYFVSPEIIDILADHGNLKIIKKSSINKDNFYLNRDYLFILEK